MGIEDERHASIAEDRGTCDCGNVAEKSAKQARNFSPEELAHATVRLAELDAGAKGGSRLPPELQLERTLVEITRPAERAG